MIWLFLAFVVVPVLEIWLITQVAGQLGWLPAIALVIAVSAAGAWLVRREGLGVIRRVRDSVQGGRMPTNDLADGAMIFFASALMLTPGFITDAVGLALLIPPIRALIRPPVVAYFRRRVDIRVANATGGPMGWPFGNPGAGPGQGQGPTRRRGDVFDIDDDGIRRADPPPSEPGSELDES